MPRGRSKKQSAEAELLPPEENDQIKVREVKHTAQWVEQRPVEDPPEDDSADFDDDDSGEDRPKRKTKNAREELRKKLRAQGVSPSTNLRLYIEKYLHSDSNAGGSYAETEFCTKYETTEEHILNKDYIDVARRWGAGKYRITVRMQNKIVDAFDQRISATPMTPVLQHVNPADPNSPQVIVQMPEGMGAQQPVSVVDPLKQMRDAAKFYKEMKQTFEPEGSQPAQPQRSEEEIIASAIIKQPAMLETIVNNLVKQAGGKSDGDEPWFAQLLKDAITTGQLAPTAQAIIKGLFPNGLFGGLSNLFPGGQNGQAPMAETQLQNQTQTVAGNQQSQLISGVQMESQNDQMVEQATRGPSKNVAGDVYQSGNAQMVASTEEQALQLLLDHCQRNAPVKVAYGRLMEYAGLLNEQYPQGSIDDYIDIFAAMPIDEALEFVKTQPNGEQVVTLPHAKEWTTALQQLIREAGQEGDRE